MMNFKNYYENTVKYFSENKAACFHTTRTRTLNKRFFFFFKHNFKKHEAQNTEILRNI